MLDELRKKKMLTSLQKSIANSAIEEGENEQALKDNPEEAEKIKSANLEYYRKESSPKNLSRDVIPQIEKDLIKETPDMSDSEYLKRLDALEQLKKKKLLNRMNAELKT